MTAVVVLASAVDMLLQFVESCSNRPNQVKGTRHLANISHVILCRHCWGCTVHFCITGRLVQCWMSGNCTICQPCPCICRLLTNSSSDSNIAAKTLAKELFNLPAQNRQKQVEAVVVEQAPLPTPALPTSSDPAHPSRSRRLISVQAAAHANACAVPRKLARHNVAATHQMARMILIW